jgi:hypothetical protein
MFNVSNVDDTPLAWSTELLPMVRNEEEENDDASPILVERTPVRMDLTHVSFLLMKKVVVRYSSQLNPPTPRHLLLLFK